MLALQKEGEGFGGDGDHQQHVRCTKVLQEKPVLKLVASEKVCISLFFGHNIESPLDDQRIEKSEWKSRAGPFA